MNLKKFSAGILTALVAVSLTACGNGGASKADSDAEDTLVIGASPSPHAVILNYVKDNLAEKAGLKLDIKEYTDYIQPNEALKSGDLDLNYFQTVPYLNDKIKESGYNFEPGAPIHLEPLGIYSEKFKNTSELKDGAKIGIINEVVNQGRALKLLASANLIKLPASEADYNVAKISSDKTLNPHNFEFIEVEGPQLIRSLNDVDIAVINGNFALDGGKKPSDALILEDAKDNQASNVLVWAKDSKKKATIEKLEKLLHSPEVKAFIEKQWSDKSVIASF